MNPSSTTAPTSKLRSCLVCRSRKVRCDKQLPCSNCRRANIACVLPSTDRPPRWSRRFERVTKDAAASNTAATQGNDLSIEELMKKVQDLEELVKDLSSQLEQAHTIIKSGDDGGSSGINSATRVVHYSEAEHQRDTSPATTTSSVQQQFGRLVLKDSSRSRYVSSAFWSRIHDELGRQKMDNHDLPGDESDSSEDETLQGRTPSTQELERTPSQRHAFLFRHNLSPSIHDLREFHPLPSQIPFLLEIFAENVNLMMQIVHIPTVTKMVRDLRGDMTRLAPANEALVFSIYHAAISSMEEDDVITNFDFSKIELNLKYRLGFEHALAKADFLNVPDITLVQALALFLCLVRRHDSPRFVWMMTGLLIRMAQYLGLQRDGAHFKHLTPFEIEMRRRVWWVVSMLDVRASEDQGTDMAITNGSFDTRLPLNINDADISPETKEMPSERDGVTDTSLARWSIGLSNITRQMMTLAIQDGAANLEDHNRLLNEMYRKYEDGYFQHTAEPGNTTYWVGFTIARLFMAKMTLIVFLPVLFSSPSEHFSDQIRIKLLVAAIEVAEYNHVLNSEHACRQWRWIYQTYTHWHAIVYLMIEISRRPWSTITERAWVALHSKWLIPVQTTVDKNLHIWLPLRRLMAKARKHRKAELTRLRGDPQATARLDEEDRKIPSPSSSDLLPPGSSVDMFRERWCRLVGMAEGSGDGRQTSGMCDAVCADQSISTNATNQPSASFIRANTPNVPRTHVSFESKHLGTSEQQVGPNLDSLHVRNGLAIPPDARGELALGQTTDPLSYTAFTTVPADGSDGHTLGLDFTSGLWTDWPWADTDPPPDVFTNLNEDPVNVNMDLNGEVDWNDWVGAAEGLKWG